MSPSPGPHKEQVLQEICFMCPLQRPARKIETNKYNLEQFDNLSIEELDLLEETKDALTLHMDHLKEKQLNDTEEARVC